MFDDPNEIFEQGLPPLVGDDGCGHVAEDVRAARLDGVQIAGRITRCTGWIT